MIAPMGDRLLVEPVSGETTTKSGFILGEDRASSSERMRIVALGTALTRPWEVGHEVLVPQGSATDAKETPADKTKIISEADIIAVIVPDKVAKK